MAKTLTEFPDAPDIESSSQDYSRRFSGDIGKWILEVQAHATEHHIRSVFADTKGLAVLDVGGGHGQNLALLNDLGCRITVLSSIGHEETMVAGAVNSQEIQFIQGQLLNMPFDDSTYDIVLCYRVMAHLQQWQQLVAELVRVSRRLVIVDYASTRSINVIADRFFGAKKALESNTRPFQLQAPSAVNAQFASVAARLKEHYGQFLFPMVLHRAMKWRSLSKFLESVARKLGLSNLFGSPVLALFIVEK